MLASLRGIGRGPRIAGQILPLDPEDPRFQMTLDPLLTPYPGGHGTLNGEGRGTAVLEIPPTLYLPGLSIEHTSVSVVISQDGVLISKPRRLIIF